LGRESLSIQDVSGVGSSVASIEVIALLSVIQGVRLGAVREVIRAEVVSRLRVGHHNQVLDVTIKIVLVINFLSE